MNRYLIRSLKYLLWLVILLALIFVLMTLTGTSRYGADESLHQLFGTSRGAMMICAIVLLALLYPRFGFVRRVLRADLGANREVILEAFARNAYKLVSENERGMAFRAVKPLKKWMLLGEDTIAVVPAPEGFALEGIRREVVNVEFRLKPFLILK